MWGRNFYSESAQYSSFSVPPLTRIQYPLTLNDVSNSTKYSCSADRRSFILTEGGTLYYVGEDLFVSGTNHGHVVPTRIIGDVEEIHCFGESLLIRKIGRKQELWGLLDFYGHFLSTPTLLFDGSPNVNDHSSSLEIVKLGYSPGTVLYCSDGHFYGLGYHYGGLFNIDPSVPLPYNWTQIPTSEDFDSEVHEKQNEVKKIILNDLSIFVLLEDGTLFVSGSKLGSGCASQFYDSLIPQFTRLQYSPELCNATNLYGLNPISTTLDTSSSSSSSSQQQQNNIKNIWCYRSYCYILSFDDVFYSIGRAENMLSRSFLVDRGEIPLEMNLENIPTNKYTFMNIYNPSYDVLALKYLDPSTSYEHVYFTGKGFHNGEDLYPMQVGTFLPSLDEGLKYHQITNNIEFGNSDKAKVAAMWIPTKCYNKRGFEACSYKQEENGGKCLRENECSCFDGWGGKDCSIKLIVPNDGEKGTFLSGLLNSNEFYIFGSILSIVCVLIVIVLCCGVFFWGLFWMIIRLRNLRKSYEEYVYNQIEEEEEEEEEEDSTKKRKKQEIYHPTPSM